jgi:hypothetical protein
LSLAYLPTTGKAVSFGDLVDGETWEWDGIAWERATPVVAPQVRQRDGMTATRDRIVMFGGLGISISGGFGPLDETWTYDGTTWTYLPTAHAPSPRTDTALGYDARRDRVVLFGGNGGGETWEWDGTDWTQSLPAHRPPSSNARVAMAYDRHAAVTVVYVTGETWTWDGLDWTQLATNGPNIAVPVITYDPLRQRVVLEGVDRQTFLIGTWEWTGSSWAPLPAVANPNDDAAHQMIYDAAHGEIMLYNSNLRVTWVHRYFSQSVPADECIDRDTDGDGLVGCADPDCAGRCTPGCAPGETCDPSAPHCGDGTCSVLENYRLCPADCAP